MVQYNQNHIICYSDITITDPIISLLFVEYAWDMVILPLMKDSCIPYSDSRYCKLSGMKYINLIFSSIFLLLGYHCPALAIWDRYLGSSSQICCSFVSDFYHSSRAAPWIQRSCWSLAISTNWLSRKCTGFVGSFSKHWYFDTRAYRCN